VEEMLGQVSKVVSYLALTPAIVQLVIVLVQLFETDGNGEAKKKAVLDTVQMIYSALCDIVPVKVSPDFVYRVASITIDIAVGFFNLVGIFKHSSESSASTTNSQNP
jgi:hypothetical protein